MGNSNEIGKVHQVIEKWVFFKLLFANPTDSSGGKNHTTISRTIGDFLNDFGGWKMKIILVI